MSNSSPPSRSIPLIHEGDSYFIYCSEAADSSIQLLYVERFPGNVGVQPTKEQFCDLDPGTKRAVIAQVNRRYQGRMVRV